MTLVYLMLAIAAFAAPGVLWSLWYRSRTILYSGRATCISSTKTLFDEHRKYAFVFIEVPGLGQLLAEISDERARWLTKEDFPVDVVVTRRFGGRPEIEQITFVGEPAPQPAPTEYPGLFLSVVYLLLGMAVPAAIGHFLPESALVQHVSLYLGALGLAMSGFCLNYLSKDSLGDISTAKSSMLGVPLGTGKAGLLAIGFISLLATIACFWTFSILILIPGLHAAFALGAVVGILMKTARSDKPNSAS